MAKKKGKKQKGKKPDYTTYIVLLILLVIVSVTTSRYIQSRRASNNSDVIEYNHFIFEKRGGMWHTQWQRDGDIYNLLLRFNPYEVENVTITGGLDDRFISSEVYVTFDPSYTATLTYVALGAAELSLNMARGLDITPVAACTINITDACSNRPIINCTNTEQAVVYIREDDEPAGLYLQGNCITISGRGMEILRAVDRLLYAWYGIEKLE
ncbi:hypothetical protein COT48_05185 [Candidatus Woesearchaeota archaeon CG08_land_8_20_14_0_20_47_9]|nr:MAG: hypothetical protein COV22_02555 [Candidatus Woesearchaeota archaeon CG10_big_fil_rev_8_21_14_0_10_47_5]PIO03364.1 MAG: hypothetical protein COT48_05185 [Candidatus Woesearchaeota archaeon CG08_land_8_20_14_0_20_47_9]HII30226.1 hypothetical protein [Candidatus Woesearchaeota archaeon]